VGEEVEVFLDLEAGGEEADLLDGGEGARDGLSVPHRGQLANAVLHEGQARWSAVGNRREVRDVALAPPGAHTEPLGPSTEDEPSAHGRAPWGVHDEAG
jgi:hypothetical protein